MNLEYNLKISSPKVTWGIFINIVAEDIYIEQSYYSLIPVSELVFFEFDPKLKLIDAEIEFIKKGIRKVEKLILKCVPSDQKVLITIKDIIFDFTDYQNDGLYCAIIGWLSKRYGFTAPYIPINFNKELNKYIIHTD